MNRKIIRNSDEITSMIEDFVQMWIKFESMLHKELAKTHPLYTSGPNHNDINYGLFYRASSIIYPDTRLTMGELSASLSVPFSKATRIANWLVDSGYVKRLPDAEDRRVVRIALTDKGQELHSVMSNYMKERVQELISSSLTAEEKITLFTLINKVASVLKNVSS
jgi:MarR family 2-MHQ and catechol resistance regulon transcriptional repressor